uniref:ATPase 8 n=1 Tax=Terrisswalkerius athertonensis TaxID=169935 RepID=Q94VQ7_9ANNE|nr:ATPase 8 [Terrisswalkerius athertonensis]
MPHLSPMSWLISSITTWLALMLFISNIWWLNKHQLKAKLNDGGVDANMPWQWFLQDGWEHKL